MIWEMDTTLVQYITQCLFSPLWLTLDLLGCNVLRIRHGSHLAWVGPIKGHLVSSRHFLEHETPTLTMELKGKDKLIQMEVNGAK